MSSVSNLTDTHAPLWNSPDNHGPVISVITWLLIVVTFLAVTARVVTRWAVIRSFQSDDITILAALLFAVGQSIATSLEVANGLGQDAAHLSSHQLVSFQKSAFASDFLYITALWLTKTSLCLYLIDLTPKRNQRLVGFSIGGLTALWATSSIFIHAFQCSLPHPWNFLDQKCINLLAFWTYFDILNILTDIGLIVLPFLILVGLQVESRKKIVILICFASRLLTIGATILQIYYRHDTPTTTASLPSTLYLPVLLTQVVLALSITTACIPYLKPFLEALETGVMRASGGTVSGGSQKQSSSTNTTSRNTALNSGSGSGSRSKRWNNMFSGSSGKKGKGSGAGTSTQMSFGQADQVVQMESLHGVMAGGLRNEVRRADSERDSTGSRAGIINKRVDWELTDEGEERGGAGGDV